MLFSSIHLSKHSHRFYFGILSIILIHINQLSFAQSSHAIFEHLTSEQGLSSDKVEAILQDQRGFYWIATQNGLNRFDGTTFKIFRHDDNDTTSITDNHCTALVEGLNGDIWIATYKGLSRYLVSKGRFQNIFLHHPTINFEIANRLYNIAADKDGNIWIAGNGLWKYDVTNDSLTLFRMKPADPASISHNGLITKMAYDSILNGIWLSTGGVLNFYSIEENVFFHKRHNPFHWKVFDVAEGLEHTLDHKHRLWFRQDSTQTLCSYDFDRNLVRDTGKKIKYGIKKISADDRNRIWIFYWLVAAEIFDTESGSTDTVFLKHHHLHSAISEKATSLYIDRTHRYWITSGNGISIYDEKDQFYILHQPLINKENIDVEPIRITALAQTEKSFLWVGSSMGLFKYNLFTGQSDPIHLPSSVHAINSLCAIGDKLWVSLYNQLFCINSEGNRVVQKFILKSGIYFLQKGDKDQLWVGLWNDGLYRINISSGKIELFTSHSGNSSSLRSNSLISGMSGPDAFWVGYNAGVGFSKYTISTGQWQHFHPKQQDTLNISAGTITVISHGNGENLWLGTHGNGVFHFEPGNGNYTHLQQQQGLNSNYINSILIDQANHLWISTADGMNYYNTQRNTIIPLDIGLVFSDNDFMANGLHGLDNILYFFCNQDFVAIDPEKYHPNSQIPQLVISRFKIFDREVPLPSNGELMRLSYRENFFSFIYSTIKTRPGKKVNYAYRLNGFDKDWNFTNNTFASYTNVPDGHYDFQLKAANDLGDWSNVLINVPVYIKPPFWRTWWFAGVCICLAALCLYAFYRYRINQIKKIFSIRNKISKDLHDDIGASLSSIHFYTSVAEKEVETNPAKAKKILLQINHRSRQIIENISDIVWANQSVLSDKSLLSGRIKNYGYDLLAQNNIECKYNIDSVAEKKLSNPEARRNVLLIIKEALNNIAKYSEAENVEVNVAVQGTHLTVDISDNGKGFDIHLIKQGNGLSNMKSRAESLHGNLEIVSAPGKGTFIHCLIPLPNISE